MIGYEGLDINGIRLHPVVIANHSKLKHKYELVKEAARKYLIQAAVEAMQDGLGFVEPGQFFVEAPPEVNAAITTVLQLSRCEDGWQERLTPDDLVIIFLGNESEPSVIEKLNYPTRAKQTKQALDNGISPELQALITCMFMTEYGDFDAAKNMIENLTPEQLEVIVATRTVLSKRAGGDAIKTTRHLAELAGVSEETAQKVLALL